MAVTIDENSKNKTIDVPGGKSGIAGNSPAGKGGTTASSTAKKGSTLTKGEFSAKISIDAEGNRKLVCNTSTVGHVDNGKTSLTAAITKWLARKGLAQDRSVDEIDKSPEEKARGITINKTMVNYATDHRYFAHVDCPGHADYVKNMITGSSQTDVAILVLNAGAIPQPQDKVHLDILKRLGVKSLIVFANKMDYVAEEFLQGFAEEEKEAVIGEIEENIINDIYNNFLIPHLLPGGHNSEDKSLPIKERMTVLGTKLGEVKIILGSAKLILDDAECSSLISRYKEPAMMKLEEALDTISLPYRDPHAPLFLRIDGVVPVEGRGTAVTGKVIQGTVKTGDKLHIVGLSKDKGLKELPEFTALEIQMFHNTLLRPAEPGENIAILVKGPKDFAFHKGQVVCAAGTINQYNAAQMQVYMLTKEEGGRERPITENFKPQFFCGTADVSLVEIIFEKINDEEAGEILTPGDNAVISVKFLKPMAFIQGEQVLLREGGKTVAAGKVIKTLTDAEFAAIPRKTKSKLSPEK